MHAGSLYCTHGPDANSHTRKTSTGDHATPFEQHARISCTFASDEPRAREPRQHCWNDPEISKVNGQSESESDEPELDELKLDEPELDVGADLGLALDLAAALRAGGGVAGACERAEQYVDRLEQGAPELLQRQSPNPVHQAPRPWQPDAKPGRPACQQAWP